VRDIRDIKDLASETLSHILATVTSGRAQIICARWVKACIEARKLVPHMCDDKMTTLPMWNVVDHRHCFVGVVATISQVTSTERRLLLELITRHAGVVRSALTSACTHVVCGTLSGAKVRCALNMPAVHIVPPCWVTNSIKKGTRQDESLHRPQRAMEATTEYSEMSVFSGYRESIFKGQAFFVVDCPASVEIKDQILRCGGMLAQDTRESTYIISDIHSECNEGRGEDRHRREQERPAPPAPKCRSLFWVKESANFRTCEWSCVALLPLGLLFTPFPRSEMGGDKKQDGGAAKAEYAAGGGVRGGGERAGAKVICVSGYLGVAESFDARTKARHSTD